jgi:hypothetical protein
MNSLRKLATLFAFLGLSAKPEEALGETAMETRAAWNAWRAGDFSLAKKLAFSLMKQGSAADEGRHLLTLTAIVNGEYANARATYEQIDPQYGRLAELDEPMLWALIHAGGIAEAQAFAGRRGLLSDRVTAARLRLALAHPPKVELSGVVEVPFTDDKLTPLMPGMKASINGHDTVVRLDTGGAFIHLTPAQARAFGVKSVVCERAFFALIEAGVCHGVAETFEIGPLRFRNVPVAILEGLPAEQIAAAFGVELGPVIGTSILQRFLTTIDSPGRRFVFSKRGDAGARTKHLSLIQGVAKTRHETPFILWNSHYMIARGNIDNVAPVNFFVDSGLVAANAEQGQAALLVSEDVLAGWRVSKPEENRFAALPGKLGIGGASREQMMAFALPDAKWREFGDWGGIKVDALASWGFLKHFAWTIDFDRHIYLFDERGGASNLPEIGDITSQLQ